MRGYSLAGGFARVFFMVILVLGLIIGGLLWMDFLGIINLRPILSPLMSLVGLESQQVVEEPFSATLLDSDRLAKERQAIAIERRDLQISAEDLALRDAELTRKESELAERESSIEEKQNSLIEAIGQYDNRVTNLEQTARYMMNMPPSDAVSIMNEYELMDLVDVLRTSERLSREADEASLVAYWLSIMSDRNRAAEIQRMLVEKPGLSLND